MLVLYKRHRCARKLKLTRTQTRPGVNIETWNNGIMMRQLCNSYFLEFLEFILNLIHKYVRLYALLHQTVNPTLVPIQHTSYTVTHK